MSRAWKIRPHTTDIIRESEYGDWKDIHRIARVSDQWPRGNDDDDPVSVRLISKLSVVETLVSASSYGPRGYLAWGLARRGGRAEVVSIAIDPAYRRLGIGTRLLWRLGSLSRVRGFRRVMATVRERDDRSIAFFRSVGMHAIGVRRSWFGDDDGYRFEISLEVKT